MLIYNKVLDLNHEIYRCPKCGGSIIFRQYVDCYRETRVNPFTGVEEELNQVEPGELGDSEDWVLYCEDKECGWEITYDEEECWDLGDEEDEEEESEEEELTS